MGENKQKIVVEVKTDGEHCDPACPFLTKIPFTSFKEWPSRERSHYGCTLFDTYLLLSWKRKDLFCRCKGCENAGRAYTNDVYRPEPDSVPDPEPPKPRRRKVRVVKQIRRVKP